MNKIKEGRLIGVILLFFYFVIGVLSSFVSLFTVNQQIAIWEETNRTLPMYYSHTVQIFNFFRIITYSIAIMGLLKLLKWVRIYVMILTIIVTVYSICFASIYVWPYLPNKTIYMVISLISNLAWIGIIIFYLTRHKIKELFKN